jgi:4-amino-4-deoxy-L-arabinose transferase-like glycosyltransferase
MTTAPRQAPSLLRSSYLAALVASCWVVAVTPDSYYFVTDPDGGLFIQAAYDWRRAGHLPQVDVYSSYGPLSYVARVVAQSVLGDRLITEVILAALAYGAAYGLFYGVCRDLSGSWRVGWALLAIALICLPRYYKWPVVLIPALTGWTALRLLADRLTGSAAAAAGGTLGMAWLFRHDYLAYSAGVITLAWTLRRRREPFVRGLLPYLVLGLAAVAGPWLIVLSLRRGLWPYVLEIAGVTGRHAVGLGLPHPLLYRSSLEMTALFAATYALPLLAGLHSLMPAGSPRPARELAWIGLGLSVVFLPQSMHRADPGHLLQVLPGCLMGAAALAHRRRFRMAAAFLLAVVVWAASSLGAITRPGAGSENVATTLAAAAAPAVSLLSVSEPGEPRVPSEALGFLRTCVPRGGKVAVYPFAPQLAWLSGHVHAAPFLVLVPGYFDDDASERQASERLRRDEVAVVLWDEAFAFDARPERRPVETHQLLHAGVRREYVRGGLVDGFSIFIAPSHAPSVTLCFQARRAAAAAAIPRYVSTLAEGVKLWQPGLPTFLAEMTGMAPHESWGRWTDGPAATLRFSTPLPKRFILVVTAASHGRNLGRPVAFSAGNVTQTAAFTAELGKAPPDVRRLSFELASSSNTIEIRPPHPEAPGAGDRRQIGLALIRLQIETASEGTGVSPVRE